MEFFLQNALSLRGFDAEIEHCIKVHLVGLCIEIKTVHLHDPFMRQDKTAHFMLHLGCCLIASDAGIDSHSDQEGSSLLIDLGREATGDVVHLLNGHGVWQLQMDGSQVEVGTIIVDDEVVSTTDGGLFTEEGLNLLSKLTISTLPQELVQSLTHHFDARLDDEDGDQDSHPSFERQSRVEIYQGGGQH